MTHVLYPILVIYLCPLVPAGLGGQMPAMSYGMGPELYQAALAKHMENLDLNPMADDYLTPQIPISGARGNRRK
eukprot:scaffold398674_cov38-Prasinocladus_malaysianus.AAC.1